MAAVARHDRGGLYQAYCACMETPCIARKLGAISFLQFAHRMLEFKVLSFYVNGEPAGAAMFRGGDGHIAIRDGFRGRWANKRTLRSIFYCWGAGRHAVVDKENARALDFVSRLGLKPVDDQNNMVRFSA